ncbi:phage regulatory CII family protein [Fundidesulfovibrio soli]|uniref:phage regulatory CII family protein n=1 Tax=Fundidesulfovibrio soli TaxID=2922716 RepID=UPI001FAF49B9|nr:phage regulatory CII family protein [Fundidesulfovibrio soli]
MSKEIYEVIKEMVEAGPAPVKELAAELGKPYSTLMRELNPDDQGAKLGVELLLPLMRACNSVMPLRYLASRMGQRVVSLREVTPDKPSMLEGMLTTYPALAEFHQAIMEGQPMEKVAELRENVIHQVQVDFVAYSRKKSGD